MGRPKGVKDRVKREPKNKTGICKYGHVIEGRTTTVRDGVQPYCKICNKNGNKMYRAGIGLKLKDYYEHQ